MVAKTMKNTQAPKWYQISLFSCYVGKYSNNTIKSLFGAKMDDTEAFCENGMMKNRTKERRKIHQNRKTPKPQQTKGKTAFSDRKKWIVSLL